MRTPASHSCRGRLNGSRSPSSRARVRTRAPSSTRTRRSALRRPNSLPRSAKDSTCAATRSGWPTKRETVMVNRFLEGWRIAVSISDSPDLASLGLGDRHLRDVMVEVARHLISAGAALVYGGDLRKKGYTELLFEVAARYY